MGFLGLFEWKMQLYILTQRTLILRLHFHLDNISLVTQIPLCTEGSFLTFRSKISHSQTSFQCLWGKTFPARAPWGIRPARPVQSLSHQSTTSTQLGPSYWKFRSHCLHLQIRKYRNTFLKYIWIFSPSTPVVLYSFFLCFHFLKQSLGEILPRLLCDVVTMMIIKHCPLEESLPMRERWPNPHHQQPLLAFLLLLIAFSLGGKIIK